MRSATSNNLLHIFRPRIFAFDCHTAPLIIVEQDAFLPSFSLRIWFALRRYSTASCCL
jgi:hypothetical protein